MPYITEDVYQDLAKLTKLKESIHLEQWPNLKSSDRCEVRIPNGPSAERHARDISSKRGCEAGSKVACQESHDTHKKQRDKTRQ